MVNQDLVANLERLLEDAKNGRMVSFQYAGFAENGDYTSGFTNCNAVQLSVASTIAQNFASRQLEADMPQGGA